MPRKTVRVDIPVHQPDKYMTLVERVWKKHDDLGISSPLHNSTVVDMTDFEAKLNQAQEYRKQALEHYATAQKLMQESRVLMGLEDGQTINTKGTLYYMLDLVKRTLMTVHMGNEESLSEWGFNVVVRMANVGRKRKK
jgi:hypothetical protein